MTGVLIRKMTRLGREENGAALMVTLALFLFMYLSGAGVFAIGKVVKDRIHLQNACDAAAYSAAIVQADTLSRIATINRAMAWTYASMTRRQMDHIVYSWLKETEKRCDDADKETVILSHGANEIANITDSTLSAGLKSFESKTFNGFYSRTDSGTDNLYDQITDDKSVIEAMNSACESLKSGLAGRISEAAMNVIEANVHTDPNDAYVYFLKAGDGYFKTLCDEDRFAGYADENLKNDRPEWFPLSGNELCRDYSTKAGELHSAVVDSLGGVKARVSASLVKDVHFDGKKAKPPILTDSYFGEKGTITVGLARYNENPWYRLLKTSSDSGGVLKGIFAAFNPYRFMEWTWAFSSAKAGYNASGSPSREYRIGGDVSDDWNLCTEDWDAVFVPVRRAVSEVVNGNWTSSKVPPLGEWIGSAQWQPLPGSSVTYNVSNMSDLPGMDTGDGADGDLDWKSVAEMLYH